EPEEESRRKLIELFVEVRAYLKISVEGLNIYIKSDGQSPPGDASAPAATVRPQAWSLALEDLELHLGFLSRPFHTIPKDIRALALIDTLMLALNPARPVQIDFQADRRLKGPLQLQLMLYHESADQSFPHDNPAPSAFALRLLLDSSRLAIYNRAGGLVGHSGLKLRLDSSFAPDRDQLVLHELSLRYREQLWLALRASLSNISVPERHLALHFARTHINLADVNQVLANLNTSALEKPWMGGQVYLDQLGIAGPLDQLRLQGQLRADEVFFEAGGRQQLRRLFLPLQAELDLYHDVLPLQKPTAYRDSPRPAFGLLRFLHLPDLQIAYNGAELRGSADLRAAQGLKADLEIRNFDWAHYFADLIQGRSTARLQITAPLDFGFLDFNARIQMAQGRYFFKRSRSQPHNLDLEGQGRLGFDSPFTVDLHKVKLVGRALNGQRLLDLSGASRLSFGKDSSYRMQVHALNVYKDRLIAHMPGVLQDQLGELRPYLAEGLALRTNTSIQSGAVLRIQGKTSLQLPDLHLTDLELSHNLGITEKGIDLQSLTLQGLKNSLVASVQGKLSRANKDSEYRPDVSVKFRLAQQEFLKVHDNIRLQGSLKADFSIKNNLIAGNLRARDLDLAFANGNCQAAQKETCQNWNLHGLNLALPVQHQLGNVRLVSVSENPAREYAQIANQSGTRNFSLKALYSSHDPRGAYRPGGFYYLGSPAETERPGIEAYLRYSGNILLIEQLMARLFKLQRQPDNTTVWQSSGMINGRDVFVNLANLKSKHMQAGLRLQIKNLDLEPFLPESQSSYDGIISGDVSARVNSFHEPLNNMNGILSIYRISREFSGFVTRIIMPAQVVAMIVRNTVEIPGIKVELNQGLVYSAVQVRRAHIFPGIFVAPGADEIKQERMPLARFLQKARDEVRTLDVQEPDHESDIE
ncbi:MAG: hypothetical protein KDK39_09960, partial [Leptospiraceae bacterium]|nr:hypothetical protein [Leptospiraceae bacterium]